MRIDNGRQDKGGVELPWPVLHGELLTPARHTAAFHEPHPLETEKPDRDISDRFQLFKTHIDFALVIPFSNFPLKRNY